MRTMLLSIFAKWLTFELGSLSLYITSTRCILDEFNLRVILRVGGLTERWWTSVYIRI
jgi:hypothetical protein